MLVQCSAGLMPTEARGNYLRETKTYHSQPVESIQHAGNFLYSAINTAHFYFFVEEVMSNYLTTDGLKKFLYFRSPP